MPIPAGFELINSDIRDVVGGVYTPPDSYSITPLTTYSKAGFYSVNTIDDNGVINVYRICKGCVGKDNG